MALIAPGAFLWTTFQLQSAQMNGAVSTAGEMWTGLVAALVLAFLTAVSYGELSDIYPRAGSGSSYYFAEAALLEKEKAHHRQYARIAKFGIGWISHLVLLDISRYYGSFLGNIDCLHLRLVRRCAERT
jgi:APA family basic amino acid/polyamine antiporter